MNKKNFVMLVSKEEDFVEFVADELLTLLLVEIEFVLLIMPRIAKHLTEIINIK